MAATALGAHQQAFSVRDHIRRDWRNQQVQIRFEPSQLDVHPESVMLNGPDGPVPVQLSAVEYGPDGASLRVAVLEFIVDRLESLETLDHVVRYGSQPRPAEAMPETALRITEHDTGVLVSTGRIGVDLALGEERWETPVAPESVPGPLRAMRLADGTRFGGSVLHGTTRVRRWRGEQTASGPVFAAFRYRYEYENGVEVTLTARIFAGDTAVRWSMETRGEAPGADRIRFDLGTGLPPLTFVFRAEFYSRRAPLVGREAVSPGDLLVLPIADVPMDWALNALRTSQATEGLVTRLTPWNDWWDDTTQTAIVLRIGNGANEASPEGVVSTVAVTAQQSGDWVEPASPGTRATHGAVYLRMMPLIRSEKGDVFLDANLTEGRRHWSFNLRALLPEQGETEVSNTTILEQAPVAAVGDQLNATLGMVLDWPDVPGRHPRLYADAGDLETFRERTAPEDGELETLFQATAAPPNRVHWRTDMLAMRAWLLTGDPDTAERTRLVERLAHHLDLLGNYDTMRNAVRVAVMYDLLIDSGLVPAADRPVFRAQLAYLGYFLASPDNWSMERGYASGNLNMSVAHVLNQGGLAAVIPEHPMAAEWSAGPLAMMEQWLNENVGPAGEFLGSGESQANYAPVSAAKILTYGIAATRAGFRDFTADPRMRRLALCLAQQLTPPDVRFPSDDGTPIAGTPASGRGPKGQRHGLNGLMARATFERDPDFSAVMQWAWNRTGQSTGYLRDRLSGLESVYMDPDLPSAPPDWEMNVFPHLGVILRHGVGSDQEWYVNFLLEPTDLTAFHSESGGFPGIWAFGKPISVRFGGKGYGEREELLISRVLPSREVGSDEGRRRQRLMGIGGPRRMIATADLPHLQYVAAEISMRMRHSRQAHYDIMDLPAWPMVEHEGELPIDWQRQIVFVRDADAAGANYLVLRDTVRGNQPTMWQFWTLSEKIGTPEEVRDVDAFLADAPGEALRDARPIEGDRFTAVGQWGVDVEYYIAAPRDTPRHTLRWGTQYHIPMQHAEFQDLLHLQLPDDGVYYVVVFPRERDTEPPRFETVGDGYVIRVEGSHGTDHVFMSAEATEADAEGILFQGVAASVRTPVTGERVISLGTAGAVELPDGTRLGADDAVELRTGPVWTVTVADEPVRERVIRLRAPSALRLIDAPPGVTLVQDGETYTLTLPYGVRRMRLRKD